MAKKDEEKEFLPGYPSVQAFTTVEFLALILLHLKSKTVKARAENGLDVLYDVVVMFNGVA